MDHISNTVNVDFKTIFEPFRHEKSYVVRDAVEMLIRITRNVLHSKEEKYKQIKVNNTTFASTVWQHCVCQRLLLSVGWVRDKDEEGNDIIRFTSSNHLNGFLDFLIEERIMKPKDEESKYFQECISIESETNKFEEEKRRRIEESKELARKEQEKKKEREELRDLIKQEMKADREYRNIRRPKSDRELLNVKESTSEEKEESI